MTSSSGQDCSRFFVAERSWNLHFFPQPHRFVLSYRFPPPDSSSMKKPPCCRLQVSATQGKHWEEPVLSPHCQKHIPATLAEGVCPCVLPPHPWQLVEVFYFWPHVPAVPLPAPLHLWPNTELKHRKGLARFADREGCTLIPAVAFKK